MRIGIGNYRASWGSKGIILMNIRMKRLSMGETLDEILEDTKRYMRKTQAQLEEIHSEVAKKYIIWKGVGTD